ncbi:MAG: hypothetical protein A3G75_05385 [Verrucomicrobia bacterium RIFCSPLOWO2_12_FULL_64_8]|nr:MAG: hypothetical protein A3G75_05385 [Verrucomicrobia bacterium RIFCSPLOWO2_12_FULL_64_8]
MDWILEHLQVLFAIAIVIVAILQKLKLKGGGMAEEDQPPTTDVDEAERTRRLQEEIRRKITERRGKTPGAPPLPSETAFPPPVMAQPPPMIEEVRPVEVEPPPPESLQPAPAAEISEALARQHQMLEDLKRYQMMQIKAPGATPPVAGHAMEIPAEAPVDSWLDELHQPVGIRRAVILREILGPPVGMR